MIRRAEEDTTNTLKSSSISVHSTTNTSFARNVCAANPDDAVLTVIDRMLELFTIAELPENTSSEVEVSIPAKGLKTSKPSKETADLKELITEIESARTPPNDHQQDKIIQSSSQSQCVVNKSLSNKSVNRKRLSDPNIIKTSGCGMIPKSKKSKKYSHPIRSISITTKSKSISDTKIKSSDSSDADNYHSNTDNSEHIQSATTTSNDRSNLKSTSKLSRNSKNLVVPFTNGLTTHRSYSSLRSNSKRSKSKVNETCSMFINALPSFPSHKPTRTKSSSGSSINSETCDLYTTGTSLRSLESSKIIGSPKFPKNRCHDVRRSSTNDKHELTTRNSMKNKTSSNKLSSRTTAACNKTSDSDELSDLMLSRSFLKPSVNLKSHSRIVRNASSSSRSRPNSHSKSTSGSDLRVLKLSSVLPEDSPNDFQYLLSDVNGGDGCNKSLLRPNLRVNGTPSQTHKTVLFNAKKIHNVDNCRLGQTKIIKQEWAMTRINSFDDSSKTFEVMEPRQFGENDSIDVDRVNTIFAVLPNRSTVCYVPDGTQSNC